MASAAAPEAAHHVAPDIGRSGPGGAALLRGLPEGGAGPGPGMGGASPASAAGGGSFFYGTAGYEAAVRGGRCMSVPPLEVEEAEGAARFGRRMRTTSLQSSPSDVKGAATRGRERAYKIFDAVPFTPNSGVQTPSPNDLTAASWRLYSPFTHGFFPRPDSPTTVLNPNVTSESSHNSDGSGPFISSPPHNTPLGPPPTLSMTAVCSEDHEHGALPLMSRTENQQNSAGVPDLYAPTSPALHVGGGALPPGSRTLLRPLDSPSFEAPYAAAEDAAFGQRALHSFSDYHAECAARHPFPGRGSAVNGGPPFNYLDKSASFSAPYVQPLYSPAAFNNMHSGAHVGLGLGTGTYDDTTTTAQNLLHATGAGAYGARWVRQQHGGVNEGQLQHQLPSCLPNPFMGAPPQAIARLNQQLSAGAHHAGLRATHSLDLSEVGGLALGPSAASFSGAKGSPMLQQRQAQQQQQQQRFKSRKNSEPKVGPDGQPRLNARQRRTLRRAKERAVKGLMEINQVLLRNDKDGGAYGAQDLGEEAGSSEEDMEPLDSAGARSMSALSPPQSRLDRCYTMPATWPQGSAATGLLQSEVLREGGGGGHPPSSHPPGGGGGGSAAEMNSGGGSGGGGTPSGGALEGGGRSGTLPPGLDRALRVPGATRAGEGGCAVATAAAGSLDRHAHPSHLAPLNGSAASVMEQAYASAAQQAADSATHGGNMWWNAVAKDGMANEDVLGLVSNLSLKKGDGNVDNKLLRDLQIIQSLIGALKVSPGS